MEKRKGADVTVGDNQVLQVVGTPLAPTGHAVGGSFGPIESALKGEAQVLVAAPVAAEVTGDREGTLVQEQLAPPESRVYPCNHRKRFHLSG
ncbi:UNVERIFIED_CONTAM: hypothetical protein Slati_0432000 [Sesamum latifolium]|uniref:Uncharacterized protein n=1 Tax=Sesamum latifolium TaxID=2727402 RepID=A0AAW2XWN1_9LAMI